MDRRQGDIHMHDAVLQSRGQITIPAPIRSELDLKPGDHLLLDVSDDGTIVCKPMHRPLPLEEYFERYSSDFPLPPVDRVWEVAADEMADRYRLD
jgi:AbrB family looped-hinge helix DNA binding protein